MIIACLAAASASGIAQSFRANSTWTSQQGSTLTIQSIAANGAFTGSYVSRAGGEGCQNQPYPVRGWIDGQKISFAVRWVNATENCQSITSWTGYIGPRGMLTHWVIVHLSGSGTPVLTSGKDIFH
jgi:hypothetical protein